MMVEPSVAMRVEWLVDSSASLTVAKMVVKMVAYWVDLKADLTAVRKVETKAVASVDLMDSTLADSKGKKKVEQLVA